MLFTSEQVSMGHPDKVCDQISDALLVEYLKGDKGSRVAIETLIKDNHIVVGGEVTSLTHVNVDDVIRGVLKKVGIPNVESYDIINFLSKQSPDIALGTNDEVGGAGDQGLMFGYATDETEEMLPIPFVLATRALVELRDREYDFLGADAKSQVTYDYKNNRIDTFLISTQHSELVSVEYIKPFVENVMLKVAGDMGLNSDFKILINPTGRFVIGGSFGDAGVTGRKIIADSYGGSAHHGGGAFSGKDPSKVDRSGAYMARKVAKDLVKSGLASKVEVQLAYAIGIAEPVSIMVNSFSTGVRGDEELAEMVASAYDLTPRGIVASLKLLDVDYNLTSSYGHFGKSYLPWEE